ncbi:MAG: hypothetical protein QG657_3321, partial [Acidobacteriota bacterium]|nr:hypothetical protein [Acidobacteriota bacterium]
MLAELKRILKEGILIVLILVALVVYILTTNKDPYFPSIALMIFLLIYASFAGWSMFDRERREEAEEYLLSMPVSRARLFFLKFAPRLLCVLLLLGSILLLNHFTNFPLYFPMFDFSIIYLSFFLVSLSFSLNLKSFVSVFFLTTFLSVGLSWFIKIMDSRISESSAILNANLVLLVFPIVFFIVFRTFDIKPMRTFNLKFIPPVVLCLGLAAGYFWLSASSLQWHGYYLTGSGDIIRYSCKQSQYIRDNETTNFQECLIPLMETNGSLYLQERKVENECFLKSLVSLDLQKGTLRPLLEVEKDWFVGDGFIGKNGVLKDGNYYNILRNTKKKQYKVLIIPGDGSGNRQIPIYGNFYDEPIDQLFHAAGNPLQFFVKTKSYVFRVFESGEAQELFPVPDAMAVWQNRLLVCNENGMTLYDIQDQLKPIFQKKGDIRKIVRKFG